MNPPASPPPPSPPPPPPASKGHALVWVRRADAGLLDLEAFARSARLHPDLVRRLVALGLLDCDRDADGVLWFQSAQLAALARIQRLRAAFSINYAALGLVVDLLDRIAELEAAARGSASPVRRTSPRTSQSPQTRHVSSQSSQQPSRAASRPIGE